MAKAQFYFKVISRKKQNKTHESMAGKLENYICHLFSASVTQIKQRNKFLVGNSNHILFEITYIPDLTPVPEDVEDVDDLR